LQSPEILYLVSRQNNPQSQSWSVYVLASGHDETRLEQVKQYENECTNPVSCHSAASN
jgi:hypothetical protein